VRPGLADRLRRRLVLPGRGRLSQMRRDPGRGQLLHDILPPGAPLHRERDVIAAGEPGQPGPQVRGWVAGTAVGCCLHRGFVRRWQYLASLDRSRPCAPSPLAALHEGGESYARPWDGLSVRS
jgi:hypothetical protein